MKLILRNATIVNPGGKWHGQSGDLVIERGAISHFGPGAELDGARVIERENLHISPGFFDSGISTGEPGREERGTLESEVRAAALSGFTDVALQPAGIPAADNASQISWALARSQNLGSIAHPIGNLTREAKGKDLAEIYDMALAGAVAFGDYNKHIEEGNLLKIALQYSADLGALVIAYCMDPSIAAKGLVHEGKTAGQLGLRGIPALAEELAVSRNLMILEYTGGRLHLPTISTAGSANLIREAKKKGLDLTCSASVHHLTLDDGALTGFDTHVKVTPPLRSPRHVEALREAVLDGTIDMITSDHNPIDVEHKKVEFALAENGTTGLESAFGALGTVFDTDTVVQKLTSGRNRFKVAEKPLEIGAAAHLALFDPDREWQFSQRNILSRSKNSAFVGRSMKGFVYGSIIENNLYLKDEN